jgi:hypothetical protein
MKDREDKIRNVAKWALIILILFSTFFLSPYLKYQDADDAREKAQNALDDRMPKLNGFIDRSFIAGEPGTTNSLIFLEMAIQNSGGSASSADNFGLFLVTTNATNAADEIYFTNEYTYNFLHDGKPYLLDLNRNELISEKAHNAIQPGDSPRGWLAFRLNGISLDKYSQTNLVLRFFDINGQKIRVTNTVLNPTPPYQHEADAITTIFPGSDNIFYPQPQEIRTNWLPPELPPGCSNVIVFFGTQEFVYPRLWAEIAAATNWAEFAIKDLPSEFLKNLDTSLDYSPRMRNIFVRESYSIEAIGGKTFPFPIQPVIVSNRLYVEVEIPFSNEKRKLIMSDSFDSGLLPIPRLWDINYSTNYDEYGNGLYYYEIVNELTNPVLQVAYYAPNIVVVNGIFVVDSNDIYAAFGQQPTLISFSNSFSYGLQTTQRVTTISLHSQNFSEILELRTNDTEAEVGEWLTNELYRPIFQYQRRIFKYPSSVNLGAFENWDFPNKNVTNIVDMAK